jgi:hypothetical protein
LIIPITSSIVLPVCLATSSNILFSPNGVVIDPLAFLDFAVLAPELQPHFALLYYYLVLNIQVVQQLPDI